MRRWTRRSRSPLGLSAPRSRAPTRLIQGLQKLPCSAKIGRLEALGKASVERRHQIPILAAVLFDSKPYERHRGTQLPCQRTLPARLRKRWRDVGLHECCVSRWHREKNVGPNTQQLWKLRSLGSGLTLGYCVADHADGLGQVTRDGKSLRKGTARTSQLDCLSIDFHHRKGGAQQG